MLFSEPMFVFVFLPLLLAAASFGSLRTRNLVLAMASLLFYAWDQVAHLYVLLASISFNYVVGRSVSPENPQRWRRVAILAGIVGNLSILGYYKYSGFLLGAAANLFPGLQATAAEISVQMPLGISFFTFQAMSYLIDVYRGQSQPQRNLVDLSLYISLFPQLIAGPIVRYRELVHQLYERTLSTRAFSIGVRMFVIGLGKKLLIADTLAGPVRIVFEQPVGELTTALAWIGLICFTLQIYFDFSGYSDMAVGLGRMFGFRIPENFRYPYAATSVTDFWRRWHITLSRWFRDYLYIPLGGNRCSAGRTYGNLLLVFLLCGFWHGADWAFIFWGFLHGFFLIIERIGLKQTLERIGRPLAHLYTLGAVMLGWVFFRCEDFGQAIRFLQPLSGMPIGETTLIHPRDLLSNSVLLALFAAGLGATPIWRRVRVALAVRQRQLSSPTARKRRQMMMDAIGNLLLLAIFAASIMTMAAQTYTPFLYFRF